MWIALAVGLMNWPMTNRTCLHRGSTQRRRIPRSTEDYSGLLLLLYAVLRPGLSCPLILSSGAIDPGQAAGMLGADGRTAPCRAESGTVAGDWSCNLYPSETINRTIAILRSIDGACIELCVFTLVTVIQSCSYLCRLMLHA